MISQPLYMQIADDQFLAIIPTPLKTSVSAYYLTINPFSIQMRTLNESEVNAPEYYRDQTPWVQDCANAAKTGICKFERLSEKELFTKLPNHMLKSQQIKYTALGLRFMQFLADNPNFIQ